MGYGNSCFFAPVILHKPLKVKPICGFYVDKL